MPFNTTRFVEVSIEEVNWTQTLRSALHEVPDLAEAHDDLAQHYQSLLVAAEEARDALSLPDDWLPHALVLVGRRDPAYTARPRPAVSLDELRAFG